MYLKGLYILLVLLCMQLAVLSQKKPLVLATYAYSTNNRLNNLKPLAQYLQEETGIPVIAESYPTVQQLMAAVLDGRVDLAMINTLGYLSFQKKHPGIVKPLVTLELSGDSITNYGGCILARTDAGIKNITDVRKDDTIYRFAMVNKASTSGNLVPRLMLNSKGIPDADRQFVLYYSGTHKQVIEDLLQNKATLGGCGCSEYDKYAQAGKDFTDKVVILASFNDIPLGPIMYRDGLRADTRGLLEKALLRAHEKQPGAFRNFCAGWSEFLTAKKFKPAKDADYDKFRSLFGTNQSLWKLMDE